MSLSLPGLWPCPSCGGTNAPAVNRCRCGAARPVYGLKAPPPAPAPGKPPKRPRAAPQRGRHKGQPLGEFVTSFAGRVGLDAHKEADH